VLQAERAFRNLLPDCSPVNLVTNRGGEGRVFLSTYPTMMNLIDAEDAHSVRRFGVGHFDLIIIDEAHRSVYQKYGAIFAYFDALLAGLTATPRDEIDRNTYELFDLEIGLPTDEYGLDQAVADGFLVPFRPIAVELKFPREGIRYADLSDDEKAAWDLLDWQEDVQAAGRVESGAINSWLFNADTVDKGLEVLMTQGCPDASGDRIGKSVIFARNHKHAEFIRERFDHHYPHLAGKAARVIDNQIPYAQSLIDAFAQPDSELRIAISVDMLDTGIDIPEIVNLVFFKPVRSRTKFWQMVGRGTRLCPHLFGPGRPKECFWISDLCQNLEFFLGNRGSESAAPPASLSTRLFRARLALIEAIDHTNPSAVGDPLEPALQEHRRSLANLLRCHLAACPADNFLVRPHLEQAEHFTQADAWSQLSPEDHNLLRDEWWQDVTLPMLEDVRRRLRDLVGLIETTAREPLYSNFSDQLAELKELDAAALLTPDTFRQFRLRAKDFLKDHDDHLTMQRLRRNQPLTPADLNELEQFLLSHGIGDQQAIERAREECNGFGVFIRSLVGMDRNAAKELFADYLAEGTHTATQIRFINEIIDELTSRGAMDPARLYDPPFSDLAPTGPEGLFSDAEAEQLFDLLQLINERARPLLAA